jgi:hypothetical protein
MSLNYSFSDRARKTTFILMGIGIITLIAGYLMDHAPDGVAADDYHHTRFWANMLINSFFFMGIGLGATFFLAMNYAAEAAWFVTLKRVFEAVTAFLPVGAVMLVIVLLCGSLHLHHLYHWMDPAVLDPASPKFDAILLGKSAYLNQPFFWIRTLLYLGVWIAFQRVFVKRSHEDDLEGTVPRHFKTMKLAAIFLVFYAVTSSTSSWDWIMSIDAHWFSTLFGWYIFSGTWISAIIAITMVTLYLKRKGHLEFVNENHLHDLAKWMFAVSFLWTYLYFSQFMLIWYANIPEEVTYFIPRIDNYQGLMWTVFFTNFALPMAFLMARDAKRNSTFVMVIGCIIFITHWLDVYMMVMPGTVGTHWKLGWMEIGMFLGFLGSFIFVVLNALTKAPLLVKSHPYLEESLNHHV